MYSGGASAACTPDSSAGNRRSEAKSSGSGVAFTGARGQPGGVAKSSGRGDWTERREAPGAEQ
jgi:hypothetical protein